MVHFCFHAKMKQTQASLIKSFSLDLQDQRIVSTLRGKNINRPEGNKLLSM